MKKHINLNTAVPRLILVSGGLTICLGLAGGLAFAQNGGNGVVTDHVAPVTTTGALLSTNSSTTQKTVPIAKGPFEPLQGKSSSSAGSHKSGNTPSPSPSNPPLNGAPILSITYVPGPISYTVVDNGPNASSPNPQYSGQSGSSIDAFNGQKVTIDVTESPSPEDSSTPVFGRSCSTSSKGVTSCHSVLLGFNVITTNWLASGTVNLSQYYNSGETYNKSLALSGGNSELSSAWKPMDLPNSGQWPNSQTQTYSIPISVALQHNGVVESGSVTINVTGSLYGGVGTY